MFHVVVKVGGVVPGIAAPRAYEISGPRVNPKKWACVLGLNWFVVRLCHVVSSLRIVLGAGELSLLRSQARPESEEQVPLPVSTKPWIRHAKGQLVNRNKA